MDLGNKIFGHRLKEVRTAAGLSQKELGILAGIDEFAASTRVNRYELGVHKADYQIASNLAAVLKIPTAYFYTQDDRMAALVLIYHRLPARKKVELYRVAQGFSDRVEPAGESE